MRESLESHIIAIRREPRDKMPPDWLEALQVIDGLTVVGAANPWRAQVLASPQANERVGPSCAVPGQAEAR